MHYLPSYTASEPYEWGKKICEKLKELLPRQQFEIAIQAGIGTKIIARETSKSPTQECDSQVLWRRYIQKKETTRKAEKGKKRMRQVGNVEVPQEAFMAVLKIDND